MKKFAFNGIITHKGQIFHADEQAAIATVMVAYGLKRPLLMENPVELPTEIPATESVWIVRYDQMPLDVDTNDWLVIDIGGGPLDHHHDPQLPASNILVLDWLVNEGAIGPAIADKLKKYFFNRISDADTGKTSPKGDESWSLYGVTRMLNNLPSGGFLESLFFFENIVTAAIETAKLEIAGERRWSELEIVVSNGETVGRINPGAFIPNWQEMAVAEGVRYLLSPNPREKDSWNVTSADSSRWPLEPNHGETWLHGNRFMASYPDLATAIKAIMSQ